MHDDEKGKTYPHQIIALFILILFLALNCYRVYFPLNNEMPIENLTSCFIEVKGEVSQPGLYVYSYCPTINDLLNACGVKPEDKAMVSQNSRVFLHSNGACLWVQKTRKGLRLAQVPLEGKKNILLGIPININTATSDDLSSLPGIGPHTADKIVSFRKAYGTFSNIEDIKAVKGIGEKRFKRIKKYLAVTTQTIS